MFKKTLYLLLGLVLIIPLNASTEEVEKVDINMADAKKLAHELYGIGQAKAEAIVKFREENGPFTAVIELLEVKGIGEKTLEANKDKLTVSIPEELPEEETAPIEETDTQQEASGDEEQPTASTPVVEE